MNKAGAALLAIFALAGPVGAQTSRPMLDYSSAAAWM